MTRLPSLPIHLPAGKEKSLKGALAHHASLPCLSCLGKLYPGKTESGRGARLASSNTWARMGYFDSYHFSNYEHRTVTL